jgi:magnesium-transporting ATPase (P-type)
MDKQAIAILPAQQALEQLHASPQGLSSSEAEKRRATSGFNVITKSRHTALDVLGRQLKSSLISPRAQFAAASRAVAVNQPDHRSSTDSHRF